MGSNPTRNLETIFDLRFPQNSRKVFTAKLRSLPLMINFARHTMKIKIISLSV